MFLLIMAFSLLFTVPAQCEQARMRILRDTQAPNRLRNADLERVEDNAFSNWFVWEAGYEIAEKSGRDGTWAAYCRSTNRAQRGIGQTVVLDQSQPTPVVISGWSRANSVTGGRDSGYAIYVDVVYQDGAPLWGQNAPFDVGTHDWQRRRVTIIPTKPIQRISVYGPFWTQRALHQSRRGRCG